MNPLNHHSRCRLSWIVLISAFLLCASPLVAQDAKVLGETASNWPGVVYQVTQIQRVKETHLLVTVRLNVGASAENPTFIGVPPVAGWQNPAELSQKELDSGKYEPTPLSLADTVLVDKTTKTTYRALPTLPADPFVGPNAMMTSLRPGNWLQMAVQFPAPPPPPTDASGKTPVQKVSLQFPNAKLPVKDLTLPPIP
jgi:hypothetical protein